MASNFKGYNIVNDLYIIYPSVKILSWLLMFILNNVN